MIQLLKIYTLNLYLAICDRLSSNRAGPVARGGTGYLVDQLRRAIASVVLNISEGNARTGPKERARFFAIARASAAESASAIDVALALRLISEADALFIKDRLLQVVKMLYKLR